VLGAAMAAVSAAVRAEAPAGAGAGPAVVVLEVRDAIGPAVADYLVRGLARANDERAALVVIEIDTPGGLDASMRQIIQAMLGSPVPVAVYVTPQGARAASAGTYILYAAQIAAMAPATTLGAATPVALGFPGSEPRPASGAASAAEARPADTMAAKQTHDAAAFIRGLAQQRGRNAAWAERAVREAVSLTASEALRQNVVDNVAADLPDLLSRIDGKSVAVPAGRATLHTRGARIERWAPGWRDRLLATITHPSVATLLLMLGLYGLIFEFMSPGFGVAGVSGAICLLLALFALQLLPVNFAGLALIVLGIALLVAEVHLGAFGVLGVGGVIGLAAGAFLLFDRSVPGLAVPLPLILALAASAAIVVMLAAALALRARRRPVVSGREQLVGCHGEVERVDGAVAWALIQGERWQVAAAAPLWPGQQVTVLRARGLTLDVRADTDTASPRGPPS